MKQINNDKYHIDDCFCVKNNKTGGFVTVLVLNRDFDSYHKSKLVAENQQFEYWLNSVNNWVLIAGEHFFKGLDVSFE